MLYVSPSQVRTKQGFLGQHFIEIFFGCFSIKLSTLLTKLSFKDGDMIDGVVFIWKTKSISTKRLMMFEVYTYLALRARAITPAARGAAADVPPCCSVHPEFRSVVAWETQWLECYLGYNSSY